MKKLLIFTVCAIFLALTLVPAAAATSGGTYDISSPEYETDIALLVNADTDTVIYSKNADQITAPASLTKIITAMVVLEGNPDLNRTITCSSKAIHSLDGTGSSIVGLMEGETTTLEMLLYCLLLPSANDAAAVLAEEFGGTEAAFVEKMNAYAKGLGCTHTHFANPHGLDDESFEGYDGEKQNQTTAEDLYKISKAALQNETIKAISSKYGKTMPATNLSDERYLYNTNSLLNSYSYYYYDGAIGLKTGTTDKAGSCLISSASKDGYSYISIALHGNGEYLADGQYRNTAFLTCRYMLNWAFENLSMKTLADTSQNLGEVGVEFGRGSDYVALVPQEPVVAIVLNDIGLDDLKVELADGFPQQIPAPVEEGDVIGEAKLTYGDVVVAKVTLVAQQAIKKNYLWAAFSWLVNIMSSKAFVPFALVLVVIIIALFISAKKHRQKKKRRENRVNVVKDYTRLGK